ncbi:Glycosyltransferase 6 domain-containing protein 1 [Pteropus alecto]|uniref:Glycosyltransferase 6 domain-containing protein 1 n=1 Tax=Pteropus alecto TaxID=9402 RepID=L5KA37_PTEAL|nr:Glycosyltransferase 6 domain-containing protein 1 [Pteropus alecto]
MRSKRKLLLLTSLVSWLWLVQRHLRKRPDVVTTTGWLAPIIWEGTFNRRALRDHYARRNLTVGLAVFAAGSRPQPRLPAVPYQVCPGIVPILSWGLTVISRTPRVPTMKAAAPLTPPPGTGNARVGRAFSRSFGKLNSRVRALGRAAAGHLEPFLRSAKKHFMTGYRAVFYIMVDDPHRLPDLEPGPLQTFKALPLAQDRGWHDLDLVRMRQLGELVADHVQGEVDFLFSAAADQVFQGDFGVETLGSSVAQLHAWWWYRAARDFPYERRPRSAACIPSGHGDFFYDGALVGGTPLRVLHLVEECLKGALQDMKHGLNSTYESHLNKYFFLHKPTTLLSPEYGWDAVLHPPAQVRYVKVLRHPKAAW